MTEVQTDLARYLIEPFTMKSKWLGRDVVLDAYLPEDIKSSADISLLIVNDGQDLPQMPFAPVIDQLFSTNAIEPVLVVGIYCNEDRRLEYGTADVLDYLGRGSKAALHRSFILKELIPFIKEKYNVPEFKEMAIAGFSLGGLSAMDIAWKHPEIFKKVGVFSGSFWWRSKGLDDGYSEETDRIMHHLIRLRKYKAGQRFFLQTGALDETADRNNNGIIDSIDDTLDVIAELEQKGYKREKDICYLELADGQHNVPTWARAFPNFLQWGWGK
jgi:enterochelin esterase-like enzyme